MCLQCLDDLSESVARIGEMGLNIHTELKEQVHPDSFQESFQEPFQEKCVGLVYLCCASVFCAAGHLV